MNIASQVSEYLDFELFVFEFCCATTSTKGFNELGEFVEASRILIKFHRPKAIMYAYASSKESMFTTSESTEEGYTKG